MKHKFSSMGRVAIALVLALSLVLVMGVPVAATHTSTAVVAFQGGESTVAGEASILDVTVTNDGGSDCAINIVKVDFSDSDFTVTGAGIDPTGWAGSLDGDVVTYTAATADDYIAVSGNKIFSPAVTNPQIFGEATVPAVLTTDVGDKASLTSDAATGYIGYEADLVGIGGNAISVEYVDPVEANSPLSVSVDVKAITVSLATDEAGTSFTSTASEVAAEINGDVDAGALVEATVDSGKDDELVPLMGATDLSDGISPNLDKASTVTPETLTVTSIIPDSFEVIAGTENEVTAGEAFSVKITAKTGETIETKYAGNHFIDFSGALGAGTNPAFELITFIDGEGTSPASFIWTTAGQASRTITATDEQNASGTSAEITINPAVALDSFTMANEDDAVIAGGDFDSNITVTALDTEGNTKTDYTGTVTWSSTDTTATPGDGLPANYTFVAGDDGVKAFALADFILKTAGSQTITVTDEATGIAKTGVTPTVVTAAGATALEVESDVAVIRANGTDTATITVSAMDDYGNVDTSITSTDKVTFTASLGDFAASTEVDFSSGTATSTALTSDDVVGTATIKVTHTTVRSGGTTLPYATTTVELVAATAVTEAWVDDVATGDWEAIPTNFEDDIQAAIDYVDEGGTVNVLPGTYSPSEMIYINVDGLTLKSTDGAEVTIIDASGITGNSVELRGNNVTFEGFTVAASTYNAIAIYYDYEGIGVKNNVVTDAPASGITLAYYGAVPTEIVESATVSGNVITDCATGIDVGGCLKDSMISDNTITGCDGAGRGITFNGGTEDNPTMGNTITGNTITDNACMGIYVKQDIAPDYFESNLIDGNTISRNVLAGIKIDPELTHLTGLTITSNAITDNEEEGILIGSWGSTNAINNNNIYGNGLEGLANNAAPLVDAENNWWGQASGPVAGQVTGPVDYTLWLTAAYAEPTDPVTTIELSEGWNLISLMKIPEVPAIATVLADLIADVTVDQVQTYSPDIEDFLKWALSGPTSGEGATLTLMDAGVGFWVNMDSADTLVVTGYELCGPAPAVPPQYEVAIGWNMIGFKFTTPGTINGYLGDVSNTLDAIYGYVDGAYFIPTELEPGLGYWIAVTSTGTIYPNLVSPN